MAAIVIKSSILIALWVAALTSHAQSITWYASLNHANYYDNEIGHYQSTIDPQTGYSLGMGVDSLRGFPFRLQLQFDHSSGHVTASNGGLGSGYGVDLDFAKSNVTGLFYPITIDITQRATIGFGVWMSILIHESYSGEYHTWVMGPPEYIDVNDEYESFNSKANIGLAYRMAFDVPISSSLLLVPQFVFRLGLNDEFVRIPESERMMGFHFGLGIKKRPK